MVETLPLFKTTFKRAVEVVNRHEHLTGEAGGLIQRKIMDRLGIIDWLAERLENSRDPNRVTYPLAGLLRIHLLLMGQGWRDQADADRLRQDPSLRVAQSSYRGQTRPVQAHHGLACFNIVDCFSFVFRSRQKAPSMLSRGAKSSAIRRALRRDGQNPSSWS